MKHISKALICTAAMLTIACSTSTDEKPSILSAEQNQLTEEAKALYPNFKIEDSRTSCSSTTDNPLVGCYVSETCFDDNNGGSRLFIADFGADNKLRSAFYFYNSSNCTDKAIPALLSALDTEFESQDEIQSESGVIVRELNNTRSLTVLGTTYTTHFFSSYHLQTNRLCLPYEDYNSANFTFTQESAENRSTNIDFDGCLVRIK